MNILKGPKAQIGALDSLGPCMLVLILPTSEG